MGANALLLLDMSATALTVMMRVNQLQQEMAADGRTEPTDAEMEELRGKTDLLKTEWDKIFKEKTGK